MKGIFFFAKLPGDERLSEEFFRQLRTTLKINGQYLEQSILYTTENAEIPSDLGIDVVVKMSSRYRHYPHFVRVTSWLAYLESDLFDRDSAFLDADLVFHRRVDEVFGNRFALAFCANPSTKFEYSNINAGCIFAKHEGKQKAIQHARNLVRIANDQRLDKEPRFPLIKSAGVWGVDEMCINTYLGEFAEKRQSSLRQIALSIGFDDFIEFEDGISLFGAKYNADPRKVDESKWSAASILHFNGPQKDRMYEYCESVMQGA